MQYFSPTPSKSKKIITRKKNCGKLRQFRLPARINSRQLIFYEETEMLKKIIRAFQQDRIMLYDRDSCFMLENYSTGERWPVPHYINSGDAMTAVREKIEDISECKAIWPELFVTVPTGVTEDMLQKNMPILKKAASSVFHFPYGILLYASLYPDEETDRTIFICDIMDECFALFGFAGSVLHTYRITEELTPGNVDRIIGNAASSFDQRVFPDFYGSVYRPTRERLLKLEEKWKNSAPFEHNVKLYLTEKYSEKGFDSENVVIRRKDCIYETMKAFIRGVRAA